MNFILPDTFLEKLRSLCADYEQRKGKSFFLSSYFSQNQPRQSHLEFIEQIQTFFKLDSWEKNPSHQHLQQHIHALRIIAATTLYTRHCIKQEYMLRSPNASVLFTLLGEALGAEEPDEQTKACVFSSTKNWIDDLNKQQIDKLNKFPIDAARWASFSSFVNQQCVCLQQTLKEYPVTTFLVPTLEKPFQTMGCSAGYFLGEFIAGSASSDKWVAAMSGGLYLLTRSTTHNMIFMLVAPACLSHALKAVSAASLSWALGKSMGLLGRSVGWSVGMSLDLGLKLTGHALTLLATAPQLSPSGATGFSLIDGRRFYQGHAFTAYCIKQLETDNFVILSVNHEAGLPSYEEISTEGIPAYEEISAEWISACEEISAEGASACEEVSAEWASACEEIAVKRASSCKKAMSPSLRNSVCD